jgi:hypothetical protein
MTSDQHAPLPGILDDSFDPTLPIEIRPGRRFPYGTIGEWVPIAPQLSHIAVRLYAVLRIHVNRARDDERAYPHQEDLGAMMGVKRRQTISAATDELIIIGAVETELVRYARGLRARIFYTVHEAPPLEYRGPVSLKQWYAECRPERKQDPLLAGRGQ